MLEQIRILNPKLIITLGRFPTRNLLNFKFDKFSDIVGNIIKYLLKYFYYLGEKLACLLPDLCEITPFDF